MSAPIAIAPIAPPTFKLLAAPVHTAGMLDVGVYDVTGVVMSAGGVGPPVGTTGTTGMTGMVVVTGYGHPEQEPVTV